MVVSKRWFKFGLESKFRHPILTSILPLFYLSSASFKPLFYQEWPRQTKPKKGQFMNFPQGHSGTKIQCESCLLSQGKTPEFTKMGEIRELFVLALVLVWFAGATPDFNLNLTSARPAISNHGLETTVYKPLGKLCPVKERSAPVDTLSPDEIEMPKELAGNVGTLIGPATWGH